MTGWCPPEQVDHWPAGGGIKGWGWDGVAQGLEGQGQQTGPSSCAGLGGRIGYSGGLLY